MLTLPDSQVSPNGNVFLHRRLVCCRAPTIHKFTQVPPPTGRVPFPTPATTRDSRSLGVRLAATQSIFPPPVPVTYLGFSRPPSRSPYSLRPSSAWSALQQAVPFLFRPWHALSLSHKRCRLARSQHRAALHRMHRALTDLLTAAKPTSNWRQYAEPVHQARGLLVCT